MRTVFGANGHARWSAQRTLRRVDEPRAGVLKVGGGFLRVDVDHLTRSRRRQRLENGRHERLQVSKAIGGGVQDHDRNVEHRHLLLGRQVAIDGQEDVEFPLRKFK